MKQFIIQGRNKDEGRIFYTGCAGEKFISTGTAGAFIYNSPSAAERRAMSLNRGTGLHGIHFTVLVSNLEEA